jgi:hypothetical protein
MIQTVLSEPNGTGGQTIRVLFFGVQKGSQAEDESGARRWKRRVDEGQVQLKSGDGERGEV